MKKFLDIGIPKEIIEKVYEEHDFQIQKWGWQRRTIYEWLAYTTEELGELSAAICDYEYHRSCFAKLIRFAGRLLRGGDPTVYPCKNGNREDIVKEAIQTATLCLKIAAMYNE